MFEKKKMTLGAMLVRFILVWIGIALFIAALIVITGGDIDPYTFSTPWGYDPMKHLKHYNAP